VVLVTLDEVEVSGPGGLLERLGTLTDPRSRRGRLCLGRGGPHQGYTTVLGNAHLGDYARFQPGPAIGMGYDDLKVIEAKKFLVAVTGGERRNSTIQDAHAVAEVIAAAAASAASGAWQAVPAVPGATFGHEPAPTPGPSHG